MQEKIPHTAVSISQGAFSAGEVHLDVVEPFLAEAVKLDHRNQNYIICSITHRKPNIFVSLREAPKLHF